MLTMRRFDGHDDGLDWTLLSVRLSLYDLCAERVKGCPPLSGPWSGSDGTPTTRPGLTPGITPGGVTYTPSPVAAGILACRSNLPVACAVPSAWPGILRCKGRMGTVPQARRPQRRTQHCALLWVVVRVVRQQPFGFGYREQTIVGADKGKRVLVAILQFLV